MLAVLLWKGSAVVPNGLVSKNDGGKKKAKPLPPPLDHLFCSFGQQNARTAGRDHKIGGGGGKGGIMATLGIFPPRDAKKALFVETTLPYHGNRAEQNRIAKDLSRIRVIVHGVLYLLH